jgi:hypothetical protein
VSNVTSLLLVAPDQLANLSLSGLAPELRSGTLVAQGPGVSLLTFSTTNGQVLRSGQLLAQLNFTAIATQSAFVPLLFSNVTSIRTNGVPLARTLGAAGRVVVVGNEPLVEALPATNLFLYGQIGSNYVLQSIPELGNPISSWQTVGTFTLTNLSQQIQPPSTNGLFFRSIRP